MTPNRRPEDRKPRSWELEEPQGSRSSTSAGCGVLLLVAVIGAVIGAYIGTFLASPNDLYFGPPDESIVGAIVGFVIGFLVGAAILAWREQQTKRAR